MVVIVFVLGRSGGGKSTSIRHLTELAPPKWNVKKFDDHTILYEMFLRDRQLELEQRKFRATEHGGFEVLDLGVYDQALIMLAQEIQDFMPPKEHTLITVEFTRNNYSRIEQAFGASFFEGRDVHFLFLAADLLQCMDRIHQRAIQVITEDDFFVDDNVLLVHYPCPYYPSQIAGKSVKYIDNTKDFSILYEQLDVFADTVLQQTPKPTEVDSHTELAVAVPMS